MLIRLLMLFILVPLAELAILIKVGSHLGVLPTILMVVGIGVFGAWLARREGWRAVGRIQADLAAGRLPGDSAIDALLVLAAGVLMITPGLLTDAAGLVLLIPPARAAVRRWLKRRFQGRITFMQMGPVGFGRGEDEFVDVEARPREEGECAAPEQRGGEAGGDKPG
jgi:UPF0716 protein FxsA